MASPLLAGVWPDATTLRLREAGPIPSHDLYGELNIRAVVVFVSL